MKEIWKDVVGFENLYQVSNLGNIKALPKHGRKSVNMKHCIKHGYCTVSFSKNGKSTTLYVHRVVAQAFLQNAEGKPEVNHIDGNKLNNAIDNLEWVTISQNQKHAIKLGLRKPSPMTGRTGKLFPTARPILQFNKNGSLIREWDCISDAARFLGCNPSCICECLNGKNRTSYGYIWKYKRSKE